MDPAAHHDPPILPVISLYGDPFAERRSGVPRCHGVHVAERRATSRAARPSMPLASCRDDLELVELILIRVTFLVTEKCGCRSCATVRCGAVVRRLHALIPCPLPRALTLSLARSASRCLSAGLLHDMRVVSAKRIARFRSSFPQIPTSTCGKINPRIFLLRRTGFMRHRISSARAPPPRARAPREPRDAS